MQRARAIRDFGRARLEDAGRLPKDAVRRVELFEHAESGHALDAAHTGGDGGLGDNFKQAHAACVGQVRAAAQLP